MLPSGFRSVARYYFQRSPDYVMCGNDERSELIAFARHVLARWRVIPAELFWKFHSFT